jgi:hypothetical protein
MGLLKKLFGGDDEDPAEAAHDAELQAFLHHGSLPTGPPTAGTGVARAILDRLDSGASPASVGAT